MACSDFRHLRPEQYRSVGDTFLQHIFELGDECERRVHDSRPYSQLIKRVQLEFPHRWKCVCLGWDTSSVMNLCALKRRATNRASAIAAIFRHYRSELTFPDACSSQFVVLNVSLACSLISMRIRLEKAQRRKSPRLYRQGGMDIERG